jgi:hypothetical protein
VRLGCLGWAGIVAILAASPQAEAQSQPPRPESTPAQGVLDVPYLPQTEALCGAAAAAMVMRYWGARDIAPQSFSSLLRGDGSGIATADLATSLNSRGWRAFDLAGSVDSVKHHLRRGRPVIALVARKRRAFTTSSSLHGPHERSCITIRPISRFGASHLIASSGPGPTPATACSSYCLVPSR